MNRIFLPLLKHDLSGISGFQFLSGEIRSRGSIQLPISDLLPTQSPIYPATDAPPERGFGRANEIPKVSNRSTVEAARQAIRPPASPLRIPI